MSGATCRDDVADCHLKYLMCECADRSVSADAFQFVRSSIDSCLAAHERGQPNLAAGYARCAETILRFVFSERADDLAMACSRKGDGNSLGETLATGLCPACIAIISTVLLLRGARRPVLHALSVRIDDRERYERFVRALCWRAFRHLP